MENKKVSKKNRPDVLSNLHGKCVGSGAERLKYTAFCSLLDHHEESHGAGTGRLAKKARVPFWHRGHRVISIPVSWSISR